MSTMKKQAPEIRFPGYTEPWEQRKFQWFVDEKTIDTPMDGNHGEKHPTSSEYVDNGIPFLMASDIHNGNVDFINCKFISEERSKRLDKGFAQNGDVLITHKATIGETAILNGLQTEYAVLTPQVTYYRILDDTKLSREFLYAFFNSDSFQKEIKNKAAQSTRAYIGISAQRELSCAFPKSLDEQKRIGAIICCLDNLITLHQCKHYHLKMSDSNRDIELFLKHNTIAWEQRKLSEIAEKVTQKNTEMNYKETLTNSAEHGIINQTDFFDKEISNADKIDGYYIVDHDDFVYNPRISTLAPVGPINRNKLNRSGVMSPLYTVFRTHDINTLYLEWFFKSDTWHSFMKFNGDSGARSDRFSIRNDLFFTMPIGVPSEKEQALIGTFFDQLDATITLHQRNIVQHFYNHFGFI